MKNVRVWKRVLMVIIVLFTFTTVTVRAEEGEDIGEGTIHQGIEDSIKVRNIQKELIQNYKISEIKELKEGIQEEDFEDKGLYIGAIDELIEVKRNRNIFLMVVTVMFMLLSIIGLRFINNKKEGVIE